MSKLILASASPRRQKLLSQLGTPFAVLPADIDERYHAGEAPRDYVTRMSRTKAQQVAQQYPEAWVLGADTIVTIDNRILGKPKDAVEAAAMLSSLSGRVHAVLTGIALAQHGQGYMALDTVSTHVYFRSLSEADIAAYIATGEPFDKAGAYAIQGLASAFVERYEGCYTNAVGLPVQCTLAMLRDAGFAPSH
jgi:septum formation protein